MTFIKEDNVYLLDPKKDYNELSFTNDEYSSRDNCLTKEELRDYLKNKNFYK
jgi:hypothetical protein